MESNMEKKKKLLIETVVLGIVSAGLYFSLYYFEDTIMMWSKGYKESGWLFLTPLVVAFIFSAVHGTFTSHFWEFFGIKAKK